MSPLDIHAMPVAEVLDLARRISDANDANCEALLHLYGAEVCDVLRGEVLRLAARAADNLLHGVWWRGLDRAAEMLTSQRDAALADAARARDAYASDLAGLRAEVRRADDERAAWRERVEAAERERDIALTRERDAARAALRDASRCDECGAWATRYHHASASFCCDSCGVGEGWADDTHAAALRAALERTP